MAPRRRVPAWHWPLTVAASLGLLWTVLRLHTAGQPLAATGLLAVGALVIGIYGHPRTLAWRYLLPGVAGMLVFVALPLAYTVRLGFTNYASAHLLSESQSRAYLLEQARFDEAGAMDFTLHRVPEGHVLLLRPPDGAEGPVLRTDPIDLAALAAAPTPPGPLPLKPADAGSPPGPALTMRELIGWREGLKRVVLKPPVGAAAPSASVSTPATATTTAAAEPVQLHYAGLREFAPREPLWTADAEGRLTEAASGEVFSPNRDTGFFESAAGRRLQPGFTVDIGLAHYKRLFGDADVRGPFGAIFVWTVAFAALTVLFATALGTVLAVVLNWEALSHRTLYRTLLFLPYAVPGFISILVFRGLFNQNFGEINAILDALFGIRPAWFAEPALARTMLLIVNTWLGYPYILILVTGLLKAIPSDLYEASAIAGAGPLTNFFRITLPLVMRPLTPLLISAFAFNFNNFVLISLLTDGRPDYLNTTLPAGTTDILVSYTYRIAFTDAGQNFGLAAAISTVIFGLVALMSLINLRLMRSAGTSAGRAGEKT